MPERIARDGKRYRSPLPIDLHFLMTAWAPTPVLQHHLLGWAMQTLEDTTSLPPGLLNRFAAAPDTFAANETVEVSLESVAMQDLLTVWEFAKHNMQISATYVARLVAIDSARLVESPPIVQTRELDAGVVGERR